MQFKFLTAATILTSAVVAAGPDYMNCLVEKDCKQDEACVSACFEADKAKPEDQNVFKMCNSGRCKKYAAEGIDKYYECLPKCYNHAIGNKYGTSVPLDAKPTEKKEGEKKEEEKKEGDKKEEDKKEDTKTTTTITGKSEDSPTSTDKTSADKPKETTTTTKAPASAPSSNAFKVVPSVFAGFVLAALAL